MRKRMTMEKVRVNLRKISQDFPKMAARSNILSTKEISTKGIKPVSPNKWIRLNPDFFPKIQQKIGLSKELRLDT